MANSVSARKRIRQSERRRQRNKSQKSALKTQLKKAVSCINADESVDKTRIEFGKAMAMLDKAGRKNVLHHNNSDRKKSKLHKKYNEYLSKKTQAPEQ